MAKKMTKNVIKSEKMAFCRSRAYLESAGKSREWFQGLPDEQAVVDKLKAFRRSEPLRAESFAVREPLKNHLEMA